MVWAHLAVAERDGHTSTCRNSPWRTVRSQKEHAQGCGLDTCLMDICDLGYKVMRCLIFKKAGVTWYTVCET